MKPEDIIGAYKPELDIGKTSRHLQRTHDALLALYQRNVTEANVDSWLEAAMEAVTPLDDLPALYFGVKDKALRADLSVLDRHQRQLEQKIASARTISLAWSRANNVEINKGMLREYLRDIVISAARLNGFFSPQPFDVLDENAAQKPLQAVGAGSAMQKPNLLIINPVRISPVETVLGDIRFLFGAGPGCHISTIYGNIHVGGNVRDDCVIESILGDVLIYGDVRNGSNLRAFGGRIQIYGNVGDRVIIHTQSGSIYIHGDVGTYCMISAGKGRASLAIDGHVGAEGSLEASRYTISGTIHPTTATGMPRRRVWITGRPFPAL